MSERILTMRRPVWLSVALILISPLFLAAHEGHQHKIMGTVTMVAPDHVMVKTKEGKVVSIAVGPATKYLKGKEAAKAADVKVNSRVVVSVGSGKEPLTATEVRLGSSAGTKSN